MNRAERRAAKKHNKNTDLVELPIKKSHDGLYTVASVIGCMLGVLWGYTSHSKIPYVFAGLLLLYGFNFGMRMYTGSKKIS